MSEIVTRPFPSAQQLILEQYRSAHLRPWNIKPMSVDGEYQTETMKYMKKIRPQQYILNVMYWATLNKMIAQYDKPEISNSSSVVEPVTTLTYPTGKTILAPSKNSSTPMQHWDDVAIVDTAEELKSSNTNLSNLENPDNMSQYDE